MFRLGLGILLGWLIFDEEGKKASNKAGKFIKDKSGEAIDYASKHIDTDKVADFVKKQISPKGIAENIAQDVAEDTARRTNLRNTVFARIGSPLNAKRNLASVVVGALLLNQKFSTPPSHPSLKGVYPDAFFFS